MFSCINFPIVVKYIFAQSSCTSRYIKYIHTAFSDILYINFIYIQLKSIKYASFVISVDIKKLSLTVSNFAASVVLGPGCERIALSISNER